MIDVWDKSCRQNQTTNFILNNSHPPPPPENRAVCEVMLEKCRAGQVTDGITRRMRFACWMTKATEAHSECGLLTAFTYQRLRERAVMLRCTDITRHVL
jgi:hypothetical protein